MSHSHTELNLSEGLTVLTGPNNCGKSAVVVAMDVLCNNLSGDFMVRHGTKECYVTVELNDTDVITWRRIGAVTSYSINGREIHRLGKGGIPDDLHQILRMSQIENPGRQGDSFEIHLGHQKSPIFLLDQPGSRSAMFFASSSDAEKLLRMQQRHRLKVRHARQAQTKNKYMLARLRSRYEMLLPIDEINIQADVALKEELHLVHQTLKHEQGTKLQRNLEQAISRHRQVDQEKQCLVGLSIPPAQQDTVYFSQLIKKIINSQHVVRKYHANATALEPLKALPAQSNIADIRSLVDNLETSQENASYLKAYINGLDDLFSPPNQYNTIELSHLIKRYEGSIASYKSYAVLNSICCDILPPPLIKSSDNLRQLLDQFELTQLRTNRAKQVHHNLSLLLEPPTDGKALALKNFLAEIDKAIAIVVQLEKEVNNLHQWISDLRINSSLNNYVGNQHKFGFLLLKNKIIVFSGMIIMAVVGMSYWYIQGTFVGNEPFAEMPDILNVSTEGNDGFNNSHNHLTSEMPAPTTALPNDNIIQPVEIRQQEPNTNIAGSNDTVSASNQLAALEQEQQQLTRNIHEMESNITSIQARLTITKERLKVVEKDLTNLRSKHHHFERE